MRMAAFLPLVPDFLRSPAGTHCQRKRPEATPRDGCDARAHDCALQAAIPAGHLLSNQCSCKLAQHLLIPSDEFLRH
jgi:hypothetical protein